MSSQTKGLTVSFIPIAPICTGAILDEANAVTSSPGIRVSDVLPSSPWSKIVKWLWSLRTRKSYPWFSNHSHTFSGSSSPSDLVVWVWILPLYQLAIFYPEF